MKKEVEKDKQSPPGCPDQLWQFVLNLYAQDTVAALCLDLQDQYDVDVVLMLFAVWLGREGECLSTSALVELSSQGQDWRRSIVLPLRSVRRGWKNTGERIAEYEAVKQLEVEAERHQFALLSKALSEMPDLSQRADSAEAIAQNLRLFLNSYECKHSVAQAVAAAFVASFDQSAARKPPD